MDKNELKQSGLTYSNSGNIYEKGRKPTSEDVKNGLENFFKVGEKRLTPNENDGYNLEVWNGKEWEEYKPKVPTNNDIRFSKKVDIENVKERNQAMKLSLLVR